MFSRKSLSALAVLMVTAIAGGAMIVSASTTIDQLGSDIDGETVYDNSGWSVAMSSDGTIVAVGAPYNDDNGTDAGHVRVYQYDGVNGDSDGINGWTQKGADIDGEAAGDLSGGSVDRKSVV